MVHYGIHHRAGFSQWVTLKQMKPLAGLKFSLWEDFYSTTWGKATAMHRQDHCFTYIQRNLNYMKSSSCFVNTKPRGSLVIIKPLALQMSLCLHLLCKYTKVMWFCKSKGFHIFFF